MSDKKINSNKVNPIFIVGAPRSGTSLLRVMLNRHPNIGLCDETYFFYYVYHRQNAFGDLQNIENRRIVIERYLETARVRRLGLDLDALKQFLLEEGTNYENLFIAFLKFYAESFGKNRYGEKTPQHAFEAEIISRIYPDCRLIHIVRDPRDVVASLKRMPWGSKSVAANARLWVNSVKAAEKCKNNENFLRVGYETLVSDSEAELRLICEFISEPFDERMLETESKEKQDLEWWFQRAQKSVSTNRIEKWRDELTAGEAAVVEWIAGETMKMTGYSATAENPSPAEKIAALAHENLTAAVSKFTNLPRLWYHWLQPQRLAAEEARIDQPDSKKNE